MSEFLRVAIVGCGAIAEWHWNALRSATRIRVTACVDPDAARAAAFAANSGGAPFHSLCEALAANVADAVAILVPHHLHEPLALEALAAERPEIRLMAHLKLAQSILNGPPNRFGP